MSEDKANAAEKDMENRDLSAAGDGNETGTASDDDAGFRDGDDTSLRDSDDADDAGDDGDNGDDGEEEEVEEEDSRSRKIQQLKHQKRKKQKGKKGAPVIDRRNKSLKMISISSAILFIAIVMVFNIAFDSLLGSKLQWDWSQTDLFSVGDVTKELLKDMGKDVKIIGLYDKGTVSNYSDIEILVDKYAELSGGKVTIQYIDPVKTPSIITKVDPNDILKPEEQDFVVWCESSGKAKVLGMYDFYKIGYNQTTYAQEIQGVTAEEAFSGAIKYVLSETTPVVYMTKGHGEADYSESFSSMITLIQNNNYLVKDLDMLTATEIPDDARLLVMLNPASDINAADKASLDAYLRKGRSLLVMTEFGNASYPVLNSLLADYNIEISNNRIRESDKDRRYQDDAYTFIVDIPSGSIAEQAMESGTLVQNARSIVELNNTKEWIKVEPFLQTSATCLIEENGNPDKAGAEGTATVGLACENSGFVDGDTVVDPARVLVVGSSAFIGDNIIKSFGSQLYNMYGFYYGLNWLVNSETDSLMITAKELPSYALSGGSNTTFWIATIVCVIVIPLGLLITALVVYRKRKNM